MNLHLRRIRDFLYTWYTLSYFLFEYIDYMIVPNCTTIQILFHYLVGRPKTEGIQISTLSRHF